MNTNDTPATPATSEPAPPYMGATAARTLATTHVHTPHPPTSTAIDPAERLRLDEVRAHLATADHALDGWYARKTLPGHTYVTDGHDAIRLLDIAVRELYRLRGILVGQIRADQDERAARVDRIIDELNARLAEVLAGDPDQGAAT